MKHIVTFFLFGLLSSALSSPMATFDFQKVVAVKAPLGHFANPRWGGRGMLSLGMNSPAYGAVIQFPSPFAEFPNMVFETVSGLVKHKSAWDSAGELVAFTGVDGLGIWKFSQSASFGLVRVASFPELANVDTFAWGPNDILVVAKENKLYLIKNNLIVDVRSFNDRIDFNNPVFGPKNAVAVIERDHYYNLHRVEIADDKFTKVQSVSIQGTAGNVSFGPNGLVAVAARNLNALRVFKFSANSDPVEVSSIKTGYVLYPPIWLADDTMVTTGETDLMQVVQLDPAKGLIIRDQFIRKGIEMNEPVYLGGNYLVAVGPRDLHFLQFDPQTKRIAEIGFQVLSKGYASHDLAWDALNGRLAVASPYIENDQSSLMVLNIFGYK